MGFVKLSESGAIRATWTEVHGVTPFDRSLTFVPTGGGGVLSSIYTMFREYMRNVWTHALSHDVVILNLAVTELLSGTSLSEADPSVHGLQDSPAIPNSESIVLHLDSEYRGAHWNTRLYRRGTAASLVDGGRLSIDGKRAWALVAAATAALFFDTDGESYSQLVLVGDGADVLPVPDPGVMYVTPVAWIRVGSIVVKSPPF